MQRNLKRALGRLMPNGFYFSRRGYCPCCDQTVRFLALDSWLGDSFKCLSCGSIPRQRALMVVLERHYPGWKDLHIHESSPNRGGRLERDCKHYLASQFFPGRPLGEVFDGYRNEDLEKQTFPDSAFDLVVTQDVMEHVYDPLAAFREIARTLKPGGAHILSVPLVNKHRPSEVWATKAPDGSPVFAGEAEFHGNPVDPRGSPVTMHWGFDIVEIIARSGLTTTVEHLDDLQLGIRAEYIEILICRRPVPQ